MPTTAELREVVARYAATISTGDAEAYAALFTPDAVQVDPYPTPPNVGRQAIRDFIQRSFDACETLTFEAVEVHPVGDRAAITFHITVSHGGWLDHAHPGGGDLHRHRRGADRGRGRLLGRRGLVFE